MIDLKEEVQTKTEEHISSKKNKSRVSQLVAEIANNDMVIYELRSYPISDLDVSKLDKVSKEIAEKILFYAHKPVTITSIDSFSRQDCLVLNGTLEYPLMNGRLTYETKDMPIYFIEKEKANRTEDDLNRASRECLTMLREQAEKGLLYLEKLIKNNLTKNKE